MTEGDMQQHLAATIESFQTMLSGVAEKQEAMYQDLQSTNQKLDKLVPVVERISMRVDLLETRFDKLETRFDKLETRFDKLETETQRRFDRIEIRLDGFDDFAVDAKQRLERIESHLQINGSHTKSSPRPARSSATTTGKNLTTKRGKKQR